jgi:predicted ATP-binding protein involved in virulence
MVKNKLEIESKVESKRNSQPFIPSYFLSMTIENVRCFGPVQTLDLSDGKGRPARWTIILGDNGVGKTTILRSLVAVTPVRNPFTLGGNDEDFSIPRYAADTRVASEWKPYRHSGESKFKLSADFSVGANLVETKNGKEYKHFDVSGYKDAWTADTPLSRAVGEVICFGYGASRRMSDTALSDKEEDDSIASLLSDNITLLNAEEWLLQADYAAHATKSSRAQKRAVERRDKIKDVLINLLPDVDDIRFTQLTEEQQKPGIEVKTPYGWVSIKELSLGYKTLIAWMVDLASRLFDKYPDSPNPLAEPAVVLVDEIDLHLHPKWQRNLMGFLSNLFPNTQFIATAHSPLVVQAATDANVVLLRREGDHVVIDNDVKAIHGWRVDQILTSDLFGLESARPPEFDNLLSERTKILSKARLTKKDRARLEQIEESIGSLPTGETPEDMEAMDVIRRAAERLKAEGY